MSDPTDDLVEWRHTPPDLLDCVTARTRVAQTRLVSHIAKHAAVLATLAALAVTLGWWISEWWEGAIFTIMVFAGVIGLLVTVATLLFTWARWTSWWRLRSLRRLLGAWMHDLDSDTLHRVELRLGSPIDARNHQEGRFNKSKYVDTWLRARWTLVDGSRLFIRCRQKTKIKRDWWSGGSQDWKIVIEPSPLYRPLRELPSDALMALPQHAFTENETIQWKHSAPLEFFQVLTACSLPPLQAEVEEAMRTLRSHRHPRGSA